jgi:hypothetical protein
LVREGVFDAFGWHASKTVEWRRPRDWRDRVDVRTGAGLDGTNPPGLAFVFHAPCTFLPRELAKLHVPRLAEEEEWALAPYAIDDATDELYAQDVEPRSMLSLAADSLTALVWGLHDWTHFHNHGAFALRAETELQCDVTALHWLALNASVVGIGRHRFDAIRAELRAVGERRFREEGNASGDDAWRVAQRGLDQSAHPWLRAR